LSLKKAGEIADVALLYPTGTVALLMVAREPIKITLAVTFRHLEELATT